MERPLIDYENLPFLPREGIQSAGNNTYMTRSLFIETAKTPETKAKALWTMAEHEVYAYDRWYPSAWMAYIYATDEYDALRKICGNVRQWEHIKEMFATVGRAHTLEAWQAEQAYLLKSKLRARLQSGALSGGNGYTTAAKMLLQMIDHVPVGRPKKVKEKTVDPGIAEDADRVLTFKR